MRSYQAYLFDLYGTLVDIHTDETGSAFWREIAGYYTEHGAAWEGRALRQVYHGLCAAQTARLQSEYPKALVEIDLLPVFRELYETRGLVPDEALSAETAWIFRQRSTTHLRAYAGAKELLEALRSAGKTVILLSNAQSCFTRPELDQLGLTTCFDRVYISSEHGFRKPDPRFFSAPIRELGLDLSDCLMIGNDPVCDVAGAAAVGMDAVYIRSALSPKAPAIPEMLIDRPSEASAVLTLPRMDLRALRVCLLKSLRGRNACPRKQRPE